MGFSHEEITGSLRLSVGLQNTKDDIDRAVVALVAAVNELRKLSPFKDRYA
jgi:cysteine desulfurase